MATTEGLSTAQKKREEGEKNLGTDLENGRGSTGKKGDVFVRHSRRGKKKTGGTRKTGTITFFWNKHQRGRERCQRKRKGKWKARISSTPDCGVA